MKIGIITQARMTSTRLPGKVMLQASNKSLLQHHIERLQWSGLPIHIATTTNETDTPIVNFCDRFHIPYYRGEEHNVLKRYYECASNQQLDIVIRCTSDCPLIDGRMIKVAVQQYLEWNNENIYYSNCQVRTFPRGFDFEVFSYNALKDAYSNATQQPELEHVTPYINQNKSGKIMLKHFLNAVDESRYSVTVDTPADYTLIKTLIEDFKCGQKSAAEIIAQLKVYHK